MTPRRQKELLEWLQEKPRYLGQKEIVEPDGSEVYEFLCCHMSASQLREIAHGKYGENFTTNVNKKLIERMQALSGQDARPANGRVSTGLPAEGN